MKKIISLIITVSLILCIGITALADNQDSGIVLSDYSATNASVAAVSYTDITAPFSGTVKPFNLEAGDSISAGDVLFSFLTTDICAPEDGTISEMFAVTGDNAADIISSYGAVCSLEPTLRMRIDCSTSGGYDKEENRILHVGETLYFRINNSTNEDDQGTCRVISVDKLNYIAEITSGKFDLDDKVNIYRSDDYNYHDKVGSGTVFRRNPISIFGAGVITKVYINPGDNVSKGDKLFSCVSADADRGATADILAYENGIIGFIAVSSGQQVWKGELLCRIYPEDNYEIVADVDEMDLKNISVGDSVYVTLDTDKNVLLSGKVTEISLLGIIRTNAAYYKIHVIPDKKANLMLNQSATLYLP